MNVIWGVIIWQIISSFPRQIGVSVSGKSADTPFSLEDGDVDKGIKNNLKILDEQAYLNIQDIPFLKYTYKIHNTKNYLPNKVCF